MKYINFVNNIRIFYIFIDFSPPVLSVIERNLIPWPKLWICLLMVFPLHSYLFCFMYFEALLLDSLTWFLRLFNKLKPLSIYNPPFPTLFLNLVCLLSTQLIQLSLGYISFFILQILMPLYFYTKMRLLIGIIELEFAFFNLSW